MPVYYENDHGINLCFKLKCKYDDSAFDLTGYTIKFYMKLPSAAVPKVNGGVCVPDVPLTLGTCNYVVLAADFDTIGSYNWELILTKLGVEIHARGNYNIVIKEELH